MKHLEGKKRFFSCFSAFLLLDGNFLVIRLIVKKDFGKRKNAHLEKVMEATDFKKEKVCPQSQGCGPGGNLGSKCVMGSIYIRFTAFHRYRKPK